MKTVILKVQAPDGFHYWSYINIFPDNMESYFSHHLKVDIITRPTDEEIEIEAEFRQPIELEDGFVVGARWMRSQIFGKEQP